MNIGLCKAKLWTISKNRQNFLIWRRLPFCWRGRVPSVEEQGWRNAAIRNLDSIILLIAMFWLKFLPMRKCKGKHTKLCIRFNWGTGLTRGRNSGNGKSVLSTWKKLSNSFESVTLGGLLVSEGGLVSKSFERPPRRFECLWFKGHSTRGLKSWNKWVFVLSREKKWSFIDKTSSAQSNTFRQTMKVYEGRKQVASFAD